MDGQSQGIHTPPEELVRQYLHEHFEGLYRYGYLMLKNNDQTMAMVLSAYTKLWEKRKRMDIRQEGRHFLFAELERQCLEARQGMKNEKHYLDLIHSDPRSAIRNPADEFRIGYKTDEAIDSLPQRCRKVFCKSRFEGKRFAEIAAELNISVRSVELQMGKALQILRTLLAIAIYFVNRIPPA